MEVIGRVAVMARIGKGKDEDNVEKKDCKRHVPCEVREERFQFWFKCLDVPTNLDSLTTIHVWISDIRALDLV